ncbi:hypothetical protein HID58_056393 [Brassica napus]|uniref:Uncharacterized protein n=1 Tax=Brassica napus TaxID=3708 RepID=A0ABQ8AN48_BRANA|nr:hypothetical protein HID58_056393 [Brassica napus]
MLRLNYDANLEASSVTSCAVSWVGSNRGRRQVSSITPGTLLIILAGRFKGKRINDCHVLKVSDVSLDKYDDHYFGKVGERKNKKGEGESLMEPLQSQALPCTYSLLSSSSACCLSLVSLLIHSNVSESSRQREREKVPTHRENDDQMAVDGALIKAIEVVSELNTCLCTVFIAQGMEPHKLVF